MPLIASSTGLVTVTSICGAGTSPFSTTMMMRGKSVCGDQQKGHARHRDEAADRQQDDHDNDCAPLRLDDAPDVHTMSF